MAVWRGRLHQDVYINGVNVHTTPLQVSGVIRFVNGWTKAFAQSVAPGKNWEVYLPGLLTAQELAQVTVLKAYGELRCDKDCKAKVVTWYDQIRSGVVPTIQNVEWTCPEP
jgi:hypothetical protein